MAATIQVVGRLCSTPKVYQKQGTDRVCVNMRLAVKRAFHKRTPEKDADFLSASMWVKTGDKRIELLTKGTMIECKGMFYLDEVMRDGVKTTFANIEVDARNGFEILSGSTKENGSNGNGNGHSKDTGTLLNGYVDDGLPCTIKGVTIPDLSSVGMDVRKTVLQEKMQGVLTLKPVDKDMEVPF